MTRAVTLPDGTVIRACTLRDRSEHNDDRDFGLYLDEAWAPTWPAEVIQWQDFGLPADKEAAGEAIQRAFDKARHGLHVEVGCIGGLGRTGTVLACMAVLAGVPACDAVEWTRANYDPAAIETAKQEDWVRWFADLVNDHERGASSEI